MAGTEMRSDYKRILPPRWVFKATAVNHLSYGATDYKKTRDWYMDLFGMTCTYDDGSKVALSFGNPQRDLYVVQRADAGINHWAFSVENFDTAAAKALMDRYGIHNRYDGDFAWHMDDNNGYLTQVCGEMGCFPGAASGKERPEGSTPVGEAMSRPSKTGWKATAMNHVSYRVPDYAATRDFYMDVFGMRLAWEDGLKCALNFGPEPEDSIYIVQGEGPVVDHLAISIADFDLKKVEDEIKKQGLKYSDDGDSAWTLYDPDGIRVQVCAEKGVYPGAARDFFHQLKK
jgi:catechol 2,3-dioxygenase-like lactoylglutathione lyase family enzyme